MNIEDIEDFTFLGNDNRPYRLMMREGEAWIHSLHPNNHWVTHTQVDVDRVGLIKNNLTPIQQAAYPDSEPQQQHLKSL